MSVDLEALINQSKERLSKHKQYLEQTSQRNAGSSAAAPTSHYQPQISTSSYGGDNNNTNANDDDHEFSPLRSNNNNNNHNASSSSLPVAHNNSSGQFYNASAARQHQQQQQQQQQQYNPYASNLARTGYNNFGEPYQQDHSASRQFGGENSQNRSATRRNVNHTNSGFYLSTRTPTKVYDRGQKFVESRESFLERQRQEAWEKEMKGCTFSPFISRKAAAMKSSGGNGGKSPSPEGSSNKNNKNKDPDAEQLDHQEFLDWCVNSDKTNVGFHVDAPSVFLHIQRQQDARKAKAEGQAKLTIDTSHWKPTTTTVQEFNFGRTDQPIRSLRKPMLQMVRLDSGGAGASRSGSEAGASRKSKSPINNLRGGGRGTTPPATSRHSKSPTHNNRRNNDEDQDEEDIEAEKQRIEKMKSLEKNQRQQQQQIQDQNEEIQRLSGMLASMKMEAEAAKAKVREMTLAQTQN